MIVDDQDSVRSGLEMFLELCSDLLLVASTSDAKEAVELCSEVQPDVILMDLMLSGKPDGIGAARTIHAMLPHVRIIALSSFYSSELVKEVFQAGITSYLYKNMSIDELADAIRATSQGQSVISPEIALVLKDTGSQPPHFSS